MKVLSYMKCSALMVVIIQLMHSFEVNIRIYQADNCDVPRGEHYF